MTDPDSHEPVTAAERWFAALAYVGMGSLAAMLWGRGNFVLPHARLAFSLYLARLLVSGFGLGVWFFLAEGGATLATIDLMRWVWHLIGLFVIGLPLAYLGGASYLPWMLPVVVIWIADAVGMTIAIKGIALPWGQHREPVRPTLGPLREEKEQLRQLRERRLAQIADATTTAASERQRERVIRERKRDLGGDLVRLDHLQHLLALGELSEARYQQLRAEVVDDIGLLRDELDALGARVSPQVAVQAIDRPNLDTLGSQLQARTLSLSFIDRSGLPLFTYGHFPLDEALIAGMLSAFNSLSREVFGSPVNKTQLAEGQVLSFVHGQWSILMGLFDAEPSPGQIARLQAALHAFERDNAAELQRDPVHPSRLVLTGLDLGADVGDEAIAQPAPALPPPLPLAPRSRSIPWTTAP
jgi:hypothetical protein